MPAVEPFAERYAEKYAEQNVRRDPHEQIDEKAGGIHVQSGTFVPASTAIRRWTCEQLACSHVSG